MEIFIDAPGRWHLSTTDGFSRRKSCDVIVDADGNIDGLDSNFRKE